MSDFENRVDTVSQQLIDDRFKALEKLDPELAQKYIEGVNRGNKTAPKTARIGSMATGGKTIPSGSMVSGFGRFSKKDVDAVLAAAFDGNGRSRITKKEEEALLIILATRSPRWEIGAREYMIEQIELNLKHLWSSIPINAAEAVALLKYTDTIDFVSEGDKHKGTGLHYTALDFKIVARLIGEKKIGAWEVSDKRSYLRIPAGQAGADGFQLSNADDIYIVKGLDPNTRQFYFSHEATHAIQDLSNVPRARSLAKFIEADAYIVQGFTALKRGVPYAAYPNHPEEIASVKVAPMLSTPVASRNDKWRSDFRKAYDMVVDAWVARVGASEADKLIDMTFEESKRRQKEETNLLAKMRRELKGKRRR